MNAAGESTPFRRTLFFHAAVGFGATAWGLLVSLAAIPVFIRVLGMEAFGLIGFYAGLQAALKIFDLGLTPTLIREIARGSSRPEDAREVRDVAATIAWIFALFAIAVGAAVVALAPWLASSWIRSQTLPYETVAWSVGAIGVLCGVQWMSSYFQSLLMGLEEQATSTAIRAVETTASSLGGIAIVTRVEPSIAYLLAWQAAVATVALAAYAAAAWRGLPACSNRPRFRRESLRRVAGFASGMTVITATSLVLAQMDKAILSRMLPLEQFGDYSLAFFGILSLQTVLILPVANVMMPRFAALIASGDTGRLATFYHLTVQILASVAVPTFVALAFFGRDFLLIWTGKPDVAANVSVLLTILAGGMALNSMMVAAYVLQLAHGSTRLGIALNVGLIAVFAPTLYALTLWDGARGAAMSYAAMNGAYLVLGLPLTHRWILPGRTAVVLMGDIAPPALVSLVAAGILAILPIADWTPMARLALGVPMGLAIVAASAWACRLTRGEIRARLSRGG